MKETNAYFACRIDRENRHGLKAVYWQAVGRRTFRSRQIKWEADIEREKYFGISVDLSGGHRYMFNERRYNGVSQRGWYRGFIFDVEFPVPESTEMLLWDFFII